MKSDLPDDLSARESLLTPWQQEPKRPLSQNHIFGQLFWHILTFTLALVTGVLIGSQISHVHSENRTGLPDPPGFVHQVWQHNLTFSQKPTLESERAWSSIIPVGRGFIHHKEVAPFISNIAVFHQLHCLHAILVAYYNALENQGGGKNSTMQLPDYDNDTGARTAMPHVRHCFDYLRRGLMCSADTNLEVLNHETHTTNGWGQAKICRDYDKVSKFAEKYANSSDTGIIAIT